MSVYRIFDISIVCPFPIKGLQVLEQPSADWRVGMASKAYPGKEIEWFHSWQGTNGDEVMGCGRHGQKYILRINGLASFNIDFNGRKISILPENNCPEYTLAHLLIDQVIPRILGHMGRVVLHASAVELPDGRAVAFAGVSGKGKSTLATAFFSSGYGLLSDDCLLLENHNGTVYAMASYPSLRLWADSAQAVVEGDKVTNAGYSGMAHYTNKQQLLFDGDAGPGEPRWIKINRLYLLDDNVAGMDSIAIKISKAGGMASIMTLIESLFTLDVVSGEPVRRSFEAVRQVAGGLTVKRLAYPRDYGILPEVIAAVCEDS